MKGIGGVLIDGFPRTLEQARAFEVECTRAAFVLYFHAENEVLIKRLLQRGETSGRADDNLESIQKRLAIYTSESFPVIQYFGQQGRVREIDSNQSVEEVTQQVTKLFGQ
jgi:adenylate kinase